MLCPDRPRHIVAGDILVLRVVEIAFKNEDFLEAVMAVDRRMSTRVHLHQKAAFAGFLVTEKRLEVEARIWRCLPVHCC